MTTEQINYRELRLKNRINKMNAKVATEPSVKRIIAKCERELRQLDKLR